MPAKDIFHGAVRSALEKDSWKITHELVELGVAKTEIVLGFRTPYVRQSTDFSVA